MPMKRRNLISDINVVPYIDVMLVLLVVFMVAAPLMVQGVIINLPETDSKAIPIKNSEPLIISVDANGNYFLEIESVQGMSLDLKTLINKINKIIEADPSIQIVLRGDSNVKYEYIVSLMSDLQNLGISNIGLITKSPSRK
jgi:biopolymer transport protein TolR|tara:strand:+ start:104 stop:526 length:423 start_codon:yes stop_codon:yes gene_type:complete